MPIGAPNSETGLIQYSEWMQLTLSRIYARSPELKKIDDAIRSAEESAVNFATVSRWYSNLSSERRGESAMLEYELDEKMRGLTLVRVRDAFEKWTKAKGNSDWRASNRNGEGAVTRLAEQLAYLKSRMKMPASELAAVAFIEAQRNRSIPVLFADCKVVAYSDRLTTLMDRKAAASAALNIRTVYDDGNALGMGAPTARQAEGFLREMGRKVDSLVHEAFFGHEGGGGGSHLIDDLGIKEVLDVAVKEIKDEIAAITPIAGLSVSAATALYTSVKLVMQSVAADDLVDLEHKLEGDSRGAVSSIKRWQLETIAKTTSKLLRSTANVTVHSAAIASVGVALPVQIAVSITNAILSLAVVIGDLGLQYRRKNALETYLNQTTLGPEVFTQSPLAAAYYLLNTETSHIALQLVNFGHPGWINDVERLKKDGDLKLVIEQSAKVIDQSRYRIRKSNMEKYRETVGVSFMSKVKDSVRGQAVVTS